PRRGRRRAYALRPLPAPPNDEFPLDPTVVEIVGDLVVIQSTINDDDSVSGDIDYVFVVQVEGGVTIYEWFRASTCRRGDPGPTELCV
ncbi:MAG: hypothetical protein ACI8RE_000764, partial [Ilumatobacter sp.]